MSELNQLSNSKYAYLGRLSLEELLDLLSVAPIPAGSPEQEAYVDALKEAIIEKENKNPTGFFPDPDQQWEQFVTHYLPCAEEDAFEPDCMEGAAFEHASQPSPEAPPKRARRFSQIWRTLLVAAAAVGCMFVIMVTAQASGLDVFGTMAQWTTDIFSFRQVPDDNEAIDNSNGMEGQVREFPSLQEALDEYGLTQIHEPTQLPSGFVMSGCVVNYSDVSHRVIFHADYVNDSISMNINIVSYRGEPDALLQKTDELPQIIEFNGITFYLIENSSNSMVAWYDNMYEYYVSGELDSDILWETAISMYE